MDLERFSDKVLCSKKDCWISSALLLRILESPEVVTWLRLVEFETVESTYSTSFSFSMGERGGLKMRTNFWITESRNAQIEPAPKPN